jgi:peptide deformylase
VLVPRAPDASKSVLAIVRAGVERYRRGVSILPIRFYGDPVLNEVTTEIDDIDGRIAALAESMIETMYEAPGVGLAANQIGVQKRMFVYDQGDGDGAFVVINPTIVETDGEWTFQEGCLSVPGLSWEITRANSVHLIGYDLEGNELDIETDEYEGRIFQHEMDHLNGMLLIDRLDADQRREAKILLREQRLQIAANDPDGLHRLFGE